jgi:hypothetical protein
MQADVGGPLTPYICPPTSWAVLGLAEHGENSTPCNATHTGPGAAEHDDKLIVQRTWSAVAYWLHRIEIRGMF